MGKGYFDNEHYTPLVAQFRAVKVEREVLKLSEALLVGSAAMRRARRLARGGDVADAKLEKLQAQLAPIDAKFKWLRDDLTVGIYLVARNYARAYPPLRAFRGDVDDWVQDAVIKTLSRIDQFDTDRGTSLLSWITSCCRFTWLPLLRKARQESDRLRAYAEELDRPCSVHRRGPGPDFYDTGFENRLKEFEPEDVEFDG